jgi:hypothetical protein
MGWAKDIVICSILSLSFGLLALFHDAKLTVYSSTGDGWSCARILVSTTPNNIQNSNLCQPPAAAAAGGRRIHQKEDLSA